MWQLSGVWQAYGCRFDTRSSTIKQLIVFQEDFKVKSHLKTEHIASINSFVGFEDSKPLLLSPPCPLKKVLIDSFTFT